MVKVPGIVSLFAVWWPQSTIARWESPRRVTDIGRFAAICALVKKIWVVPMPVVPVEVPPVEPLPVILNSLPPTLISVMPVPPIPQMIINTWKVKTSRGTALRDSEASGPTSSYSTWVILKTRYEPLGIAPSVGAVVA
jgi:hypothetical protein